MKYLQADAFPESKRRQRAPGQLAPFQAYLEQRLREGFHNATRLWREIQETPEAEIVKRHDAGTIRRLIAGLAEPFRETFVLREIENLSYREIADVAEVPVGTVMSRLARARAMLRSAWLAEQERAK